MGGAFTAMTGDSAALSFYNPAGLARLESRTVSGTVSVYNKYDTKIGEIENPTAAPLRVNKGYFRPKPSASGAVQNHAPFWTAFSVVTPDFDYYTGEVKSNSNTISNLILVDESLWVGGSVAIKFLDQHHLGLTTYYTAQNYSRSINDRNTVGNNTTVTIEDKNFTNNNIVVIGGYQYTFLPNWTFGLSVRLPSVEISGTGTYSRTVTNTAAGRTETTNEQERHSESNIPPRVGVGIAYEKQKRFAADFDIHIYGPTNYDDLDYAPGADRVQRKTVINYAIGVEPYLREWLSFRLGFYSNYSSFDYPNVDDGYRKGDSVDMWGFSANTAIRTKENVRFTFGGYYTGGRGNSAQYAGGKYVILPKTQQIFTMLISTGFEF